MSQQFERDWIKTLVLLFSTLLRVNVKAALDVGDGLRFFCLPTLLSPLTLSTSPGTFNPLYFSLISSFFKEALLCWAFIGLVLNIKTACQEEKCVGQELIGLRAGFWGSRCTTPAAGGSAQLLNISLTVLSWVKSEDEDMTYLMNCCKGYMNYKGCNWDKVNDMKMHSQFNVEWKKQGGVWSHFLKIRHTCIYVCVCVCICMLHIHICNKECWPFSAGFSIF